MSFTASTKVLSSLNLNKRQKELEVVPDYLSICSLIALAQRQQPQRWAGLLGLVRMINMATATCRHNKCWVVSGLLILLGKQRQAITDVLRAKSRILNLPSLSSSPGTYLTQMLNALLAHFGKELVVWHFPGAWFSPVPYTTSYNVQRLAFQ